MLNHLRFDVFEPQETKLPERLINEHYSRTWGHETTPLRVQGDIEDVSSELTMRVKGCTSWMKRPEF
ncbi:hypothetical protein TNCV_2462961 [Trichonephila clavipes]|nr:hypothetical protein TNCV_2462961 [Trichonephila clavipes]